MLINPSPQIQILLIASLLLAISIIGARLTWRSAGQFWVIDTLPIKDADKAKEANKIEEVRRRGAFLEISRAVSLAVISTITLLLFSASGVDLESITSHVWYRGLVLGGISASLIWTIVLGPNYFFRHLLHKFKKYKSEISKENLRKPYLLYNIYLIAVWVGLGGLIIAFISAGVVHDWNLLSSNISNLGSISTAQIEGLQKASILLVDFGGWVTGASQKYIVVSVLIFAYLILEQRSGMGETIMQGSIDRLKIGVWFVFLLSLGIGLVYFPSKYQSMHEGLQGALRSFVLNTSIVSDLDMSLSVQQHLEDHGFFWLITNAIFGYGNLITLSIIGGAIVIRKVFFSKVPFTLILKLVLPSIVYKRLLQILGELGL